MNKLTNIIIDLNKITPYVFVGIFLFLFSFSEIKASTICTCAPSADSLQLVEIYNQSNGMNWTTPWDLSSPMSTWFGVVLTPENCVKELNLYQDFNGFFGNGLTGNFPDLNLPELTRLVLQGNNMNGSLPDFSGLPALQTLNLNGNSFIGIMPDFASNPDLVSVALDANDISGELPDFPGLPDLTTFSCYFCDLTGEIPDFSATPQLQNLYLGQNELEGEIPDFSNLPNLRILNVENNELTGPLFEFSDLPALEELFLGNNNLTGNILDFQNYPDLRTLELSGNDLTGTIPDFSGLPVLQNLRLGFNDLEGTIPDFSQIPELKVLDISRAGVEGNLPTFTGCPAVEKISLIGNELGGAVPDYSSLPLITLRLQENNFENLPDLSVLNNWGNFNTNGFLVHENRLTFADILPNMAAENSGYWQYAPQDSIGQSETVLLLPGASYTIDLMVDEGINTNVYTWFKDGLFYQTLNGVNELTFTNLQSSDAGTYTCEVSNAAAPDLTLYSRPVTLTLCTLADASFAYDDICEGEDASPVNIIVQGGSFSFAVPPSDGAQIDAISGLVTNTSVGATYEVLYTVNANTACPSSETGSFTTFAEPQITNISTDCAPDIQSYSVFFSTDAQEVSASQGSINQLSGQSWEITNIPSGQSIEITAGLSNLTCETVEDIPAPDCPCPQLNAPSASTSEFNICEGETVPFFTAETDPDYTINWYDAPTGGSLLAENTSTYQAPQAGTFYAETFDPLTQCSGSERTAFTLNINRLPVLQIIETACDTANAAYSVSFTADAADITLSEGVLTALSNNTFTASEVRDIADLEITVANDFCSISELIPAPNCFCERIVGFDLQEPSCFGEQDGSITLNPGETYSNAVSILVNDEMLIEEVELPYTFNNLGADNYTFFLRDNNGCAVEKSIALLGPDEPLLDLGEDQTITAGESIQLNIQSNLQNNPLFFWEGPTEVLSCSDCFQPVLKPSETSFFRLSVTDEAGCTAEDFLRIFVERDIRIFAPDVFSPNNDGANDFFTLYGNSDQVEAITQLLIFDRWGNQIFTQNDLIINQENAGWDGKFRGREVPNDVYAWAAEVRFTTGEVEVLKGSITVLR